MKQHSSRSEQEAREPQLLSTGWPMLDDQLAHLGRPAMAAVLAVSRLAWCNDLRDKIEARLTAELEPCQSVQGLQDCFHTEGDEKDAAVVAFWLALPKMAEIAADES